MNDTSNNINDINNLDRTDDNQPINPDHKAEYVAHFNKFFETFKCNVADYKYSESMDAIGDYCKDYIEYGIIPYMDITNYIYDMSVKDEQKNEHLSVNLEVCFKIIYNELLDIKSKHPKSNEEESEYKNKDIKYQMLLKIYTHVCLAKTQSKTFYQLSDSMKGELDKRIIYEIQPKIDNIAKKNEMFINKHIDGFKQDMKKSERDSITILGIFVAIVLAFTGSVIIPTNLVNNAANIGAAKLVLLLSGIAFVFINLLYQLIRFILIINDNSNSINKLYDISVVNVILIIVFAISLYFL